MRQFFNENGTILLFAQGLVFFALALAVWLQRRRATRLTLSSSLIWLAGFAFVEALAVWGRAFIPIQRDYMEPEAINVLGVLRVLVQVSAFLFLLQFALRLIRWPSRVRHLLMGLGVLIGLVTITGVALATGGRGWGIDEWESVTVGLARYGLLLPAALLAAVGLWRQRAELSAAGMPAIKPYAAASAAALGAYGLVAGLIVAPGPLSSGGLLDSDGWFEATGAPVSLLLALTGLMLAVFVVKLLEIFDAEAAQRMEALDRARAIAEERARFRRDLHDGTIQSIYAAGLHLEAVAIRCEDPSVRGEVREVVSDLNAVTDGIRNYIRALAQPPATPDGVASGLAELTRRFREETGRQVDFAVEGVASSGPLPDEAPDHLRQILREALSNTVRHAGPCRVRVRLRFAPDELDLVICDNGRGPGNALEGGGDGHGQGLRNMRERARRLSGRVSIEPSKTGGTCVTLAIPLDSEEPAGESLFYESLPEVSVK